MAAFRRGIVPTLHPTVIHKRGEGSAEEECAAILG
jgi:hypothetical protein